MEVSSAGNPGILKMNAMSITIEQHNEITVSPDLSFEEKYWCVRQREQRIYSDDELRQLPQVAASHVYYEEWRIRERSAVQLSQYLMEMHKPLHILEVGCGNGWLSNCLAALPGSKVVGTDINRAELQQASNVFTDKNNLQFIYGDIMSDGFMAVAFDIIVFAASIQYFSSFHAVISRAFDLLKPGGEVHLIDSPFYTNAAAMMAAERSREYYFTLGYPEMAAHYYHRRLDELDGFDHSIMHRQTFIQKILGQSLHPFPWIRIKKPNKAR